MSYYITDSEDLTDVADAIRTKGGTSEPLTFPSGFTSAINNISSGGDVMVVTVTKTGNVYYADKTYNEIQSAVNNNKFVYCVCLGAEYYLASLIAQYVMFQTLPDPQANGVYSYTITITNNNAISRTTRNYTKPSIPRYTTIINVDYDTDNNKYRINNIVGADIEVGTYGIISGNYEIPVVRLYNNNSSYGPMDGGETLYNTLIEYDPNYQYLEYGEDPETGGVIFTFKNIGGTKTVTIKVGDDYQALGPNSPYEYADVIVTTT